MPGWKIFQVTNEKLKLGEQRRKYIYICLGIVVIDSSIYVHIYALNYLSTYSIFLSFIRFAILLEVIPGIALDACPCRNHCHLN